MGNEESKFVYDKLFIYAPLPQYYPEEEFEQEPLDNLSKESPQVLETDYISNKKI